MLAMLMLTDGIFGQGIGRLERQLVYVPRQEIQAYPDALELPYQPVQVTTEDGLTLQTWRIAEPDSLTRRPWLMYFHGNANNISGYLPYAKQLYHIGFNVLLVEYRGYMGNPGTPSEAGLYQDARANYQYLRGLGIAPDAIILYGYSLGTGVVSELASQVDAAGIILEAAYTSIPEVARAQYGRWLTNRLFQNRFATLEKIASIDAPLLMMHSRDDRVVPFRMGQAVFAAAAEPKTFIPIAQGGHNMLSQGMPDWLLHKVVPQLKDWLPQQYTLRVP